MIFKDLLPIGGKSFFMVNNLFWQKENIKDYGIIKYIFENMPNFD